MSNEIYGFAEFSNQPAMSYPDLVSSLEHASGLGVALIPGQELYHFPPDCQPDEEAMIFRISDGPGIKNAEILISGLDFAPEANIDLPLQSRDRMELLIHCLELFFSEFNVSRLCIAPVQCNEIDEIVRTSVADLRTTILEQFEILFPPTCIFDIKAE